MGCIHYSEYPDMGARIPICLLENYCNYESNKKACPNYLEDTDDLRKAIAMNRAATIAAYKVEKGWKNYA